MGVPARISFGATSVPLLDETMAHGRVRVGAVSTLFAMFAVALHIEFAGFRLGGLLCGW